jgi:hypothetical protein
MERAQSAIQGGINTHMPVEVGVKVTLSVKKESGETDSKSIPLKDFKSPNTPGTPEFWEDVLGYVAKYRLRPDTTQKTLVAADREPAKSLAAQQTDKDKKKGAAKGAPSG